MPGRWGKPPIGPLTHPSPWPLPRERAMDSSYRNVGATGPRFHAELIPGESPTPIEHEELGWGTCFNGRNEEYRPLSPLGTSRCP
jgi:hypothetical protein